MKVLFETPHPEDGVLVWVRKGKRRDGCGRECLRLPEVYVFLLGTREIRQEGQQERLGVDKGKLSSGQESGSPGWVNETRRFCVESAYVKGCWFNLRAPGSEVSQPWVGSQLSMSRCDPRLLHCQPPLASETQHSPSPRLAQKWV